MSGVVSLGCPLSDLPILGRQCSFPNPRGHTNPKQKPARYNIASALKGAKVPGVDFVIDRGQQTPLTLYALSRDFLFRPPLVYGGGACSGARRENFAS
jgi:hypothetical protein